MPKNESVVQLRRLSNYFSAEFPEAVGKDYIKDFDSYPPDVLTQAIDRILERASHLQRPPTRADVRESVQRVLDTLAEKRKVNTPTVSGLKPVVKLKPEQRKLAQESIRLIQRLFLKESHPDFLAVDALPNEKEHMAEAHEGIWESEAAAFRKWVKRFRVLPTLKPGNHHPLPDVDARVRPERYSR